MTRKRRRSRKKGVSRKTYRGKYVKRGSTRDMKNPAYAKFRKDVRDRDGNACKWPGCGSRSRLEVHHIRTWSAYPSMRFDICNGITLCNKCHKKVTGSEDVFADFFIKILEWNMIEKIKKMDKKKDEDE